MLFRGCGVVIGGCGVGGVGWYTSGCGDRRVWGGTQAGVVIGGCGAQAGVGW